jgi:DNA-directed RNA polymerase subunit RPC12/RpoP
MKEFDTEDTDEIVCPYCGYKFSDSWEYAGPDGFWDVTCHKCERAFNVTANMEITYTSEKLSKEIQ